MFIGAPWSCVAHTSRLPLLTAAYAAVIIISLRFDEYVCLFFALVLALCDRICMRRTFALEQAAHLLFKFPQDFLGEKLHLVLVGYIRPEVCFDTHGEWRTTTQARCARYQGSVIVAL